MSFAKNLKAIFFDLDNVLVFSEIMHFKSWQMALKKFDINSELHFESFIGIDDFTQSKLLKEQFQIKENATVLWEQKRKSFFELIRHGFEFPAGTPFTQILTFDPGFSQRLCG